MRDFQDTLRRRQGAEICNFAAPSPLDFFDFSPVDFFHFSPGSLCNFVSKWAQDVEKFARFPGGEKRVESCHVSGCHGFFPSRDFHPAAKGGRQRGIGKTVTKNVKK